MSSKLHILSITMYVLYRLVGKYLYYHQGQWQIPRYCKMLQYNCHWKSALAYAYIIYIIINYFIFHVERNIIALKLEKFSITTRTIYKENTEATYIYFHKINLIQEL